MVRLQLFLGLQDPLLGYAEVPGFSQSHDTFWGKPGMNQEPLHDPQPFKPKNNSGNGRLHNRRKNNFGACLFEMLKMWASTCLKGYPWTSELS